MLVPIAFTLIALALLLIAEHRSSRLGVWIAKPLASSGFIAVAWMAGAQDAGDYGRFVLLGLALCWLGDVLLIPLDRPLAFRAGILAFLLGHVAYGVAFTQRAFDPVSAGVALLVLILPAVVTLRWLWPHVSRDMALPVFAYVAVITAMLVAAIATWRGAGQPAIVIGALSFYLSDLSVARDRFVAKGFVNGLWGLPAYYGGQLLLASTAGG